MPGPTNQDKKLPWIFRSWFDPRRTQRRLFLSVLTTLLTSLLVPRGFGLPVRLVAGWNAGTLLMLMLTWWIIIHSNSEQTRRRAATQDPGRTIIWVIVLISCAFSLFAAAVLLRKAHHVAPSYALLLAGLCLGAVITSWLLTHTAFALRYAHLYYRLDVDGEGGLCFPGNEEPDDWDFAYLAFTLGMCFQVSDVSVTSRTIRRYALLHALLSFAYNTVILALALNLVFGLLG